MEINLPQVPTMLLWSHTQKMIHSSTELLDQPHSLQLYSYYPEIWINLDVHKHKSRIKIVHLHKKLLLSSLKIGNSQINRWIKKNNPVWDSQDPEKHVWYASAYICILVFESVLIRLQWIEQLRVVIE